MATTNEDAQTRLESLIEINRLMLSVIEPSELVKVIINSARRLFSAEACSIAVIDEEAHQLVFVISAGGAEVGDFRIKIGQGIVGWVAQTGEPVICRDTATDPRFFSGVDSKTGFHTTSLMCAPMTQRQQIIGAIEVINIQEPDRLTDADLRLLTVFGGLAGTAIDRARVFSSTHKANLAFQELFQDRYRFVMGASPAMQSVVGLARTVAATNATILLLGESGTGKEVLARSIHNWSSRASDPFIAVNCVALTPELMESELFGHEKGAFTGAVARKPGKFELAEGGTIFLDEIGELTPNLQTKLLRVLQEREFQRVGGTKDIRCNVRVLAATNRDLGRAIQSGAFREDLYYRLNVVSLTMPPLRERREDIPALIDFFVVRYCREVKRARLDIQPAAMALLQSYPWPGNVRELQNTIERAVVLCPGTAITTADLPAELWSPKGVTPGDLEAMLQQVEVGPLAEAVDQFRKAYIRKALTKAGGNQTDAARALGLQRSNLSRLMKALGMR
jgi:Nif-specific regulatory protein